MDYINQHFVKEAYLRAWCDPETPMGAFVWTVSKKDRRISRRSPRSLFSSPDFYTVYDSYGNRILELEHRLHEIENRFISLRRNKLQLHQSLTPEDRQVIAIFISTMFARTKRHEDEQNQIWQEYLDLVETLPLGQKTLIKKTNEYMQVQEFLKQPMPYHMFHFVNLTTPYLFKLNCAIYETDLIPGLITSDNPVLWFDPAVYNPNIPLTFFGIGSPTLNILIPISPKQYISLERNGPDGYIDLHTNPDTESELVDLMNNLTATNCDDFIVVARNTFKEQWFSEKQKSDA
jgi:hypothetical protein